MKTPALVLWSGGKDCSMVLREARLSGEFSVQALITTVTESYDRVSMHGVRTELLRKQADALGVALHTVEISRNASNDEYESKMDEVLATFAERGIPCVVCGDIFLEDVREYREMMFDRSGLRGVYPVWGRDTRELAGSFIDLGFESRIVCLDPGKLDVSFGGRKFDAEFLKDLPPDVDPCGENGEFHTFVYDGPGFDRRIECDVGETVEREGFVFTDLITKP